MGEVKIGDVDTIELSYTAECGFCGIINEDNIDKYEFDSIEEAITDSLNSSGWEMIDSEKFGGEYLACPDCAALNDDERGE